ncbi:uncharacterized protein pdgfbb isoform X2 [Cololabis saira]|nr:uncharacterized protein pdgfbb isoform X2 [Cololabis saira]
MLDRSNANFLLWPPCVEVQRCSGCCNTKSLHCVPVATHTRYLQVMKIEYINKRPTYAKAVVSVVDHVECRCQLAPRPVPRKKSSRRHHGHLHRNGTLGQEQVKVHSKDELHQLDELKQNQRAHMGELLEQHWTSRGDAFSRAGEGYSHVGEETTRTGEDALFSPHWTPNSTRLFETEKREYVERKDGDVSDDNRIGGDGLPFNNTEGRASKETQDARTHGPLEEKFRSSKSHTSGLSQHVSEHAQVQISPTEDTLLERVGGRIRPTKEPNPDPRGPARRRENETPDVERILQLEQEKLEAERKELLLLHKRLDQEKEILRQQQIKREEEKRLKDKEADHQRHSHGKHHHLQTTTQKPDTTTSTTTTQQPAAPAAPRVPARPTQMRRRLRKNRKRISKAAMRAMLM